MRILLDTHVLLWWLADDSRLSEKARASISDPANEIFVSAASVWEVVIKQALGKVVVEGDLEGAVSEQGFVPQPITIAHAAEVASLPEIHRDPFDRILVAQSRAENLQLLTADQNILRYPANVLEV